MARQPHGPPLLHPPVEPTAGGAPAFPSGCHCQFCPLRRDRDGDPVLGEGPERAELAVVGEAPGHYEVRDGRPFVGPSGSFLTKVLASNGVDRAQIRVTNALLCKPPGDQSMEQYLLGLARENAQIVRDNVGRKADGEALAPRWPNPFDCCRPRLLTELAGVKAVIPLGGTAMQAVIGQTGILKWRGSVCKVEIPPPEPLAQPSGRYKADTLGHGTLSLVPPANPPADLAGPKTPGAWVVPTIHPAFVLRDGPGRILADVLRSDIAKAVRVWRKNESNWVENHTLLFPEPDEVVRRLGEARRQPGAVAVDVETTGGHVMTTTLLCVGFAWNPYGVADDQRDVALVVPLQHPNGLELVYSPVDTARILEAMRELLADPHVGKVFHNHVYDVTVLEAHKLPVRGRIDDTMLMHHSAWAEFPHRLAFVASLRLDTRYWKDDVREDGRLDASKVDERKFYTYNARDVYSTLRLKGPLLQEVKLAKQEDIYAQEVALAKLARKMQGAGMLVDLTVCEEIRKALEVREEECRLEMQVLLDKTDYRRRMLLRAEAALTKDGKQRMWAEASKFNPAGSRALRAAVEALSLPVTDRTPTNLIATGHDVLARCLPYASADGRAFIRALTLNKKGEAVTPADLGWRPCQKLRSTYLENPPVLQDGRLHPDYRVTGTVTGRWSSVPNVQNWPSWVRRAVVAPVGYVLLAADYKALEWRIAAAMSGDLALAAMFAAEDPHRVNASNIFGIPPEAVTKTERNLAKRALYGMAYLASAATIYENLLPEWPELTLGRVDAVVKRITATYHVWHDWRKQYIAKAMREGVAISGICGRKRLFLAHREIGKGEIAGGQTEIANWPAQSTAADATNVAALKLDAILDDRRWAGVRCINQVHDSLVFEVPEPLAEAWKGVVSEVMPGPYKLRDVDLPVTFPVDIKVGKNWAEV